MRKEPEPDRIPITSPHHLSQELSTLYAQLERDETEHTWEHIDRALKRFHAVVRGGVTKTWPDEFVKAMRDKRMVTGLVRSMITERTRLSDTALEVLSSITRLGSHFLPLLPLYLPPLLRLLSRTNKLYLFRASKTLSRIISATALPDILKYLVMEWKDVGGKATSFRFATMEAVLEVMALWEREVVGKRVEELEWLLRTGATDRDQKVRAVAKKVWEAYRDVFPDRVLAFTAPMTPTIRRYLNITSSSVSSSQPASRKPAPPPPNFTSTTTSASTSTTTASRSLPTSRPGSTEPTLKASTTLSRTTGNPLSTSHGPSRRPPVPSTSANALSQSTSAVGSRPALHAPKHRPPSPVLSKSVPGKVSGGPPTTTIGATMTTTTTTTTRPAASRAGSTVALKADTAAGTTTASSGAGGPARAQRPFKPHPPTTSTLSSSSTSAAAHAALSTSAGPTGAGKARRAPLALPLPATSSTSTFATTSSTTSASASVPGPSSTKEKEKERGSTLMNPTASSRAAATSSSSSSSVAPVAGGGGGGGGPFRPRPARAGAVPVPLPAGFGASCGSTTTVMATGRATVVREKEKERVKPGGVHSAMVGSKSKAPTAPGSRQEDRKLKPKLKPEEVPLPPPSEEDEDLDSVVVVIAGVEVAKKKNEEVEVREEADNKTVESAADEAFVLAVSGEGSQFSQASSGIVEAGFLGRSTTTTPFKPIVQHHSPSKPTAPAVVGGRKVGHGVAAVGTVVDKGRKVEAERVPLPESPSPIVAQREGAKNVAQILVEEAVKAVKVPLPLLPTPVVEEESATVTEVVDVRKEAEEVIVSGSSRQASPSPSSSPAAQITPPEAAESTSNDIRKVPAQSSALIVAAAAVSATPSSVPAWQEYDEAPSVGQARDTSMRNDDFVEVQAVDDMVNDTMDETMEEEEEEWGGGIRLVSQTHVDVDALLKEEVAIEQAVADEAEESEILVLDEEPTALFRVHESVPLDSTPVPSPPSSPIFTSLPPSSPPHLSTDINDSWSPEPSHTCSIIMETPRLRKILFVPINLPGRGKGKVKAVAEEHEEEEEAEVEEEEDEEEEDPTMTSPTRNTILPPSIVSHINASSNSSPYRELEPPTPASTKSDKTSVFHRDEAEVAHGQVEDEDESFLVDTFDRGADGDEEEVEEVEEEESRIVDDAPVLLDPTAPLMIDNESLLVPLNDLSLPPSRISMSASDASMSDGTSTSSFAVHDRFHDEGWKEKTFELPTNDVGNLDFFNNTLEEELHTAVALGAVGAVTDIGAVAEERRLEEETDTTVVRRSLRNRIVSVPMDAKTPTTRRSAAGRTALVDRQV